MGERMTAALVDVAARDLEALAGDRDGPCPLYPFVRDRLGPLAEYPDHWGSAFWPSWTCFAADYLRYRAFMLRYGIRHPVIDLGCAEGFQSELFRDQGYTGVDTRQTLRFNEGLPGVRYETACGYQYPVAGQLVIANMSLGIFAPLAASGESLEDLVRDALCEAAGVFIAAPQAVVEAVAGNFDAGYRFAEPESEEPEPSPIKKVAVRVRPDPFVRAFLWKRDVLKLREIEV